MPYLYSRNGRMVSKEEYDEWKNPQVKKPVVKKVVKKAVKKAVPVVKTPVPPVVTDKPAV